MVASELSNARGVSQIDGYAACYGGGYGARLGVAVEVCIGVDSFSPFKLSNYWALMAGVGAVSGFEMHGTVAVAQGSKSRDRMTRRFPVIGEVDPVCVAVWGPGAWCPPTLS